MPLRSADELACLVALHTLPGMTHRALTGLIKRFGTVERAVHGPDESALAEVDDLSADTARGVLGAEKRLPLAERMADRLRAMGAWAALRGDAAWPPAFEDLSAPPGLVYMAGNPDALAAPTVGLVGTRKPSRKGRALAHEMAARLARTGCTIVSGLARGVDTAAHRGACSAEGRTVFVLPEGLLGFRPGGRLPRVRELLATSLVISECAPDAEWSSQAAVARNRLIAALCDVLIVVETRPKGGAMHTFRDAQKLGRPVFVVRYEDPPPSASGNNTAIARGARPLTCLADLEMVTDAAR